MTQLGERLKALSEVNDNYEAAHKRLMDDHLAVQLENASLNANLNDLKAVKVPAGKMP